MCGIAGIWWPEGQRQGEAEVVAAAMAARLHHRGPDARGVWADGAAGIALGHARLSILDLSPAGAQPMVSASGRHVVVFNGEIYNHLDLRRELEAAGAAPVWRGHSDTETLLALCDRHGIEAALRSATGMFALAVWDRAERTLTLARDRMGEKPLYFGRADRALVFASELKALRAAPGFEAEIDPASVAAYLRHSCVPEPHCIYRGVRKVEPGALVRLSHPAEAAFAEPRSYWSLGATIAAAEPLGGDYRAMCNEVEACLAEVVRSQMLSDVPLGCFLSGGIDSSLTAALMTRAAKGPVRTYAIGFEDARFNEAPHARRVAEHLGTAHTEFTLTEVDALSVISELPAIYDEPFADPSQIPTLLLARLTRQHVTVALSGDGGDEVFGGYNRYTFGPRMLEWGQLLPAPLRRAAGRSIQALQRMGTSESSWLRPAARGLGLPMTTVDKLSRFGRAFADAGDTEALYRGLVSTCNAPASLMASPAAEAASRSLGAVARDLTPAEWMMATDALTYLPGDILVKVDRAAMSASLETRAPFLDRRVVELAWRLPISARIEDGKGKRILRDILNRYVPRQLMERPKQGFAIPLDAWLRGPLRAWAEDLITPAVLRETGVLDAGAVGPLWDAHQGGQDNAGWTLWAILMLQSWLRTSDLKMQPQRREEIVASTVFTRA
ncbi:asparagine synthase (glutamine-hydrolyzing) [Rhodomicrobium vannielii ATCC 17100]|uniref:asparagine synthase (glutamine-hydrolyzing) n=1 Tax=Rhodomicrobium vannielii (strain ATCC 17100 / DSM 162 / LMG 4299 / NCIMB 10020 / ATH 3.1.1) TaxID=648757 RepID=E3I7S3_RHOVT|nr:asparagine synthase (glutamine-hydrolyzing) [Rhodomicrobium vannielii]ADP69689.1 asparagine synthase (glutamine-hydrolyzing) [Rhodomicrobium vannielii ATCC 17100]